MTYSILAHDQETGTYGGAAATGSLCVGGWVLRGSAESGLSASQGTSPSTLWGEEALRRMQGGEPAQAAVEAVVSPDPGREHRQLAVLDPEGRTGHFSGTSSVAWFGAISAPGLIACGNMLSGAEVLSAAVDAFTATTRELPDRLMTALRAGEAAGGDNRGLKSAALLVVGRDMAPLTLRVDKAEDPISALGALLEAARSEPYAVWTKRVPTLDDPFRAV